MRSGDVKVDRSTRWGNPFLIGRDGTRDEVIAKYEAHLRRLLAREEAHGIADTLASLASLDGKRFFCWCKPLACHGDVLVRMSRWAATAWPAKQAEWEAERIEMERYAEAYCADKE